VDRLSIDLKFTAEDWQRIEQDWSLWWAGELERPMVMIENPLCFPLPLEMERNFLLEKPVEEVLDHFQMLLEAREFYGDAWPKWWPNFGPGIAAGFLGAEVKCEADNTTVWFEPTQRLPIQELHCSYDPDNMWWRRIVNLTRAAVERWGDQVSVAHTDLGGNLDILASLRGSEQLLYDVIDAPDEVLRLSHQITREWLRYYDELDEIIWKSGRGTTPWAPIWSAKRCYMLQCDFSYMISPQMFARFALPDLSACTEHLDHAFYHLDGKGEIPHLDMLLSLEKLKGIQWIPGDGQPPPEEWLPLLKRIRDGGKLCQVFVSAEGARTIVRELGGRGFAFYIMSFINSREEAEDFIRILSAEDRSRKIL
jgi:5-methyltetrahydrofolate--homocysteine methyltransferase